ncbi:MAG: class I SAM-dependent methyltransferase [Candidatus Nanoarchaeia archaeon]|nr:class I SAM-dependent methyltransferase [Candidatus Nanoarchaeia archaeon]
MDKIKFNTEAYKLKFEDSKVGRETYLRIKKSLSLIGKGKKVLDVGCYDGYISNKIKDLGNVVIGMEISKEGVKLAKERGIDCFFGDVEGKFPFKDQEFDVVFAGEIIEHVFDTDLFLSEIKRVLKKDGFLVLTTPNIAAFNRRLKLFIGKNPDIDIGLVNYEGKGRSAGHIRYFTKKSLEKLLKRNGFYIQSFMVDCILVNGFRFDLLSKLFPSLGWSLIVKAKLN